MRKIIASVIFSLAALLSNAMAQENYPDRVITLVTPYAAGGGSDVLTRILAEALGKNLGQTVIVKNVTGAGGVIGSQEVARAKPDGYTLLHHHVGIATSPTLYKDLKFDPIKDFEPIGLFAESPMVLVAGKSFPPNNVKELLDYFKKNKTKITFASSGMGSSTHLCAMQVEKAADTQVTMIQYKGAAPATLDVQAGRVNLLCDVTAGGIVGHIKSGELKAFFVTGDKRLATLPDVPTASEVGLKDLSQLTAWYGLYAPAGTPKPIINRLSSALQAAMRDPAVAARVAKLETTLFDPKEGVPDALHEELASQVALWKPLLEKALAGAK
jgi:tripartite-type tricarboxylate transporter receptor subunit TctC